MTVCDGCHHALCRVTTKESGAHDPVLLARCVFSVPVRVVASEGLPSSEHRKGALAKRARRLASALSGRVESVVLACSVAGDAIDPCVCGSGQPVFRMGIVFVVYIHVCLLLYYVSYFCSTLPHA